MEKFNLHQEAAQKESDTLSEQEYQSLDKNREMDILAGFAPEQQAAIRHKQRILASLAFFIGKDFKIPIELGLPTPDCPSGWRRGIKADGTKFLQMNAHDLLEKPMDYLRFVTSHEGGHARISRTNFISLEEWRQPGFSFMMNAIEDPRDNNFVAEAYPKFKEQMDLAYNLDLDLANKYKAKAKEKLGYQPRFMQAGFEYIKQWFLWQKNEVMTVEGSLPEEVKEAVKKTLASAENSWRRFPTKRMADGLDKDEDGLTGEESIVSHAEDSYKINRDKIWPEFKKLVEEDIKDQRTQEMLNDMKKDKGEGGGQRSLPPELKDKLTLEEQKTLEEAIDQAAEEAKKGEAGEPSENEGEDKTGSRAVDLDSLPEALKKKIKDYLDSLSDEKKRELSDKAAKAINELEREINEDLEGKLADNPDKKAERVKRESSSEKGKVKEKKDDEKLESSKETETDAEAIKKYRDFLAKELKKDANEYERYRREVIPIIKKLEDELREIFVARRTGQWEGGFKSGKRIDIKKRIQEKAKGILAVESKAWQKREHPLEKDYAITLLVDLSGSMQGKKIEETFKAVIVLAEVLNSLSIKTEILGFNDRLYEYQKFGESMSKDVRNNMGGMLEEVNDSSDTSKARWNDDGWALEQASERLAKQKANQKFIMVLSDGAPIESPMHPRREYDLHKIVKKIATKTDQKLIGLGLLSDAVAEYYPDHLAGINAQDMAGELAKKIKEIVADY